MILQALHRLAERQGLVEDLDYEWKPIGFLVRVGDGGRLLGVQSTYAAPEVAEAARRRPRPRPKPFLVPRESARTSGDRAQLFFDKAEYVFGIDPDGRRPRDRLLRRFLKFREQVQRCADETADPGARAVRDFLTDLASGTPVTLPEEVKSNDLFAFIYGDEERLVTTRPAVKAYVKERRQTESDHEIQCLITGEIAPPADLHTQIKYIPGASSSGVPFVSFNQPAFESYGWRGNANAPVSRRAGPSLRNSAGARSTVMRLRGKGKPEFWIPERTQVV